MFRFSKLPDAALKFIPPLIYAAGLGALMLADVMASSLFGVEDVATWSRIRAINGILAIICLLGLDQFLLRYPGTVEQIRAILLVQIPLAAACAALIGYAFSQPVWMLLLLAILSSVGAVVAQFHRSRGRLIASQLSQQAWKVVFLLGIVCRAFIQSSVSLVIIITICTVISLFIIFAVTIMPIERRGKKAEAGESHSLRDIYAVSIRLMAISALTTLSLYLEQLIVNIFGQDYDAAVYFTHATYFLFSASFLNGYLSFLAIPWAKANPDKFREILTKWKWQSIALSICYVAAIQIIAAVVWDVLTPVVGKIDWVILIAFSFSALSRTLYTYPSAFFGAFGERSHYNMIVARYAASLVVAIIVFVVLWWGLGLSLVYSVALASASNWLLRTIVGLCLVNSISSEKAAPSCV